MARNDDEITRRVNDLVDEKLRALGIVIPQSEPTDPKDRADYIGFGSKEHADLLGIRKATEKDTLEVDGWALVDMTAFGPQASEAYIKEVLRQKVNELTAGAPNTPPRAPSLWTPDPLNR